MYKNKDDEAICWMYITKSTCFDLKDYQARKY